MHSYSKDIFSANVTLDLKTFSPGNIHQDSPLLTQERAMPLPPLSPPINMERTISTRRHPSLLTKGSCPPGHSNPCPGAGRVLQDSPLLTQKRAMPAGFPLPLRRSGPSPPGHSNLCSGAGHVHQDAPLLTQERVERVIINQLPCTERQNHVTVSDGVQAMSNSNDR